MCYTAVRIFQSLTAAERRELCQFMRDNRKLTLCDAVLATFDVYIAMPDDDVDSLF